MEQIRLEEVTPENWRPGLTVDEAQRHYVSDCAGILARAWAYRGSRSRAWIVYDGETPVGMALYYDLEDLQAYDFSQLLIDRRYQRRGYGRQTAELVLQRMEADGRYDRVLLCYKEGNHAARALYEALGFRHTGEADGDEIVMEKVLR